MNLHDPCLPPTPSRSGMPDLEALSRKLERGRASLSDLCQMYRASSRLPMIEAALRAHEGEHHALLVER